LMLKDDDLAPLVTLVNLREINIVGNPVFGPGFKHLTNATELTKLSFGPPDRKDWRKIGDEAAKHIGTFKKLESLSMSFTSLTDAGLQSLTGCAGLKELQLDATSVTFAGVKNLEDMRSLERLRLMKVSVTDEGLKAIWKLPALKELSLLSP